MAHADPDADPAALTPQGRYRDSVTEDPEFVWEMPDAGRLLTRSTGEQSRPDTAGQERTRDQPGRGARALRRAGEGDRDRRRAAHHPL